MWYAVFWQDKMWHSFFYNMVVLIGMLFICIRINNFLYFKSRYENIRKWLIPTLAGIVSILMMVESFKCEGMIFDIRSVPVFVIAYVYGFRAGVLSSILPSLFRIYIGGNWAWQGICAGLISAVIIGSLFSNSQENKLSNSTFNTKRILKIYLLQCLVILVATWVTLPISYSVLLRINAGMTIFSLIALYCIMLFVNDYNKSIYLKNLMDKNQEEIVNLNKELKKTNSILYTLIDVMPAGIIVSDSKGNITLSNLAADSIHAGGVTGNAYGPEGGYTLHKINGEAFPAEELPLSISLNSGKVIKDIEILVRYEDGTEKIILCAGSPVHEGRDIVIGAVSVFFDITERKIMEESLSQGQRITEGLINSIDEIMLLTDAKGTIITLNEICAKEIGMKIDQIRGGNALTFVPQEFRTDYENKIEQVIRLKVPVKFERKIGRRFFDLKIYPVMDEKGEVYKLSVISQDITELKEAVEMKNRFIANVSHELKTPLNITMNYIEYLLEEQEGDLNIEQKEILEIAYRNTERLQYLINDLLEYSLLESQRLKFNFTTINLSNFISDLMRDRKFAIRGKAVNIQLELPSNEICVLTDALRLRQVVDNILDNAVKFSDGEKIKVYLREEENYVEIYIKDSGIGIEPSKLQDIFKPFYQVDNTSKKKYEGVGLGLCISKKIIMAIGGDISVSNNKDKGCCFKITIPLRCNLKKEYLEENIYY